jgi:Tfp pilus assembly protein PilX
MRTHHERGIALVITLFLMSALSILGASLMFLAQSETYASSNYRMMSQARYAAESGIHRAGSYLLDGTYPLPDAATIDAVFDRTKSPIQYLGQAVVLSAGTGAASNYPIPAVVTAFATAGQGALTAGLVTLTYKTTATLIAMQVFDAFGGTQSVVQTWRVTSEGGVSTVPKATVEVIAMIEQPKVSANSYAAFATADTCDALYLSGTVNTDSYDSSTLASGATPVLGGYGGDIGSNGNVHIQGNVDVAGNLYSPKAGVGACTAGAVTAETETGGAISVECSNGDTGSDPSNPCLVKLPKTLVFQAPTIAAGSTPDPNVTFTLGSGAGGNSTLPSAACATLGLTAANCTFDAAAKTVTLFGGSDITLPNVVVNSGYSLIIQGSAPAAQNVNINSFGGAGNVTITADKGTMVGGVLTDIGQSVVLKVAGKNPDGTDMANPFDLGDWVINSDFAYDASILQIAYGGTASFTMAGNNTAAATIYAPNAAFKLNGTSDFYGSILAKTIDNGGTPKLYYDRRLSNGFWVAGSPVLGSFTWSRY